MNLEDSIVEIAPQLERFFGTSGRMLKPSVATIAAMLVQIPSGQVVTTDALRRTLADQFGVEVTCPYDTKMALLAISNDSSLNQSGLNIPFWRVIKTNGELIPKCAGGLEAQTKFLRAEGFMVDATADGKKAKLKVFKDKLFTFN
jgi:6-O-methylguanine DNA methyltransferase, DNA binding domain